ARIATMIFGSSPSLGNFIAIVFLMFLLLSGSGAKRYAQLRLYKIAKKFSNVQIAVGVFVLIAHFKRWNFANQ
ncbi:MAG: hypothetical protein II231_07235, partial [Rikenellaceae bacterium]|nr:hypothetical protein [Rikenellaceae bacterium]